MTNKFVFLLLLNVTQPDHSPFQVNPAIYWGGYVTPSHTTTITHQEVEEFQTLEELKQFLQNRCLDNRAPFEPSISFGRKYEVVGVYWANKLEFTKITKTYTKTNQVEQSDTILEKIEVQLPEDVP